MKHVFVFDADKCSACSACMMGCLDQNDTDIVAGDQCFRKTYNDEVELEDGSVYYAYISAACMHCVDAPCIPSCPVGCLSKDSETGFTVYDNTNCIGCKSCAMACPFGAPRYRKSDGKMVKCDGCNIRVKNGLEPACVKSCTFSALTCVPEDEFRAGGSKQACNVLIDQLHLRKK